MHEQDRLAMEQDNAPAEEDVERIRQAEAGDASGHCGCGNAWRFVEEKLYGTCCVCVAADPDGPVDDARTIKDILIEVIETTLQGRVLKATATLGKMQSELEDIDPRVAHSVAYHGIGSQWAKWTIPALQERCRQEG